MAQVLVTDSYLEDIADAIRDKNGGSATYKPAQMAPAILALPASSYTKIGEITLTVSATNTSATAISGGTFTNSSLYTADSIVYVRVRDTAGKRAGYFYGSDSWFLNYQKANGGTSTLTYGCRAVTRFSTSSQFGVYTNATTSGYGVYPYDINSSGRVRMYQRYNSNYTLTINGTYKCEFYLLDTPDGVTPFQ